MKQKFLLKSYVFFWKESEEMRSNSLDSKLKAKEVELKRHEQEIADQDEVLFFLLFSIKMIHTVDYKALHG